MDIRQLERILKLVQDNPSTFIIYRQNETNYPDLNKTVLDPSQNEQKLHELCRKKTFPDHLLPVYNPFTETYELMPVAEYDLSELCQIPETELKCILTYHIDSISKILTQIAASYGKGESRGPAKKEKRTEVTEWLQFYEVIDPEAAQKMNDSRKWTAEQFRIAKEWFHPYQIASHFENSSRLMKIDPFPDTLIPTYLPIKADRICKLPLVSESFIKSLLLSSNPPKDLKEMFVAPYGYTDQFDDEKPWTSCFPTHNPKDYATLMWSIKKRLRFVKERENELNYNRPVTLMLGLSLFNKFVDYYQIPELNFDDVAWMHAIDENYNNRLNKSFTTLLNKLDVCDPDFNVREAGLFMKAQGLTKIGRLYKEAKAGQMIIELKEMVILLMGVAIRYIGNKIDPYLKEQLTMINYRLKPTKMFKFVRDVWDFSKLSTSNDFTLFDTNQGVEFVRFQVAIMQHLNIPSFIVDFYEDYKLNLVTKYGPLGCMTLSGEPPTFLFNSYDNIAYSLLKYNIKPRTPALIGGDDGTFNAHLTEREDFAKLGKYFTLTAVSEYGHNPSFCGWHFTTDGPYKDPLLLVHRLYRAKEMHNLVNVIDSYSDESKYAYTMGDAIYSHMTELEIYCQSFLNNFFITHAHLLHSASAYRMTDNELLSLNQNL